MAKKVLVATEKPFAKKAVDGIAEIVKQAGYELRLLESYKDKADLLKAVADVDALIIRSDKVDAAVLDAGKQLKIIVHVGHTCGGDASELAAHAARLGAYAVAAMAPPFFRAGTAML